LDEVAAGEVVVIERNGKRVVLRTEPRSRQSSRKIRDYSSLLRVPGADEADEWGWEWQRPGRELKRVPRNAK